MESKTNPSGINKVFTAVMVLFVGLFLVYYLCAVASSIWLAYQVPLLDTDLAHASWMGGRTLTSYFRGLSTVMASSVVLIGVFTAFVKSTPMPLLIAAFAALGLAGNTESHAVRIGIAQGTVKVGCFVYESRECRNMLGLSVGNAPSRYDADGKDAEWYSKALSQVRGGNSLDADAAIRNMGMPLMDGPLYVFEAESIRRKLAEQREELKEHLALTAP